MQNTSSKEIIESNELCTPNHNELLQVKVKVLFHNTQIHINTVQNDEAIKSYFSSGSDTL